MKINWNWLILDICISIIAYMIFTVGIAVWLVYSGWNLEEHKCFIQCWAIIPTIIQFIGMIMENAINERK